MSDCTLYDLQPFGELKLCYQHIQWMFMLNCSKNSRKMFKTHSVVYIASDFNYYTGFMPVPGQTAKLPSKTPNRTTDFMTHDYNLHLTPNRQTISYN